MTTPAKLSALFLFLLFCISACVGTQQSTIGDGKVDEVEAASIRVAVGLAFAARPDTIAPAYAVTTALLAGMKAGAVVELPNLDGIIAKEVALLKLDPLTAANFDDLITLVKAKIKAQVTLPNLPDTQKMVVVKQVVEIVQQSAALRLGIK
jgi:hypothetical protein